MMEAGLLLLMKISDLILQVSELFASCILLNFSQMISYLYTRLINNRWLPELAGHPNVALGVLLKKSRGNYVCHPPIMAYSLVAAVQKLNVEVTFEVLFFFIAS